MPKPIHEMEKHNQEYQASGLSIKKYCASVGISVARLRNYRYLNKLRNKTPNTAEKKIIFKEYDVGLTFKISVNDRGLVSLHDIAPEIIPQIIRACRVLSE